MMVLAIGGSGSGKSAYAEEFLLRHANGEPKYYLATMSVSDREAQEKVNRHRARREGKGFVTIEQPRSLEKACGKIKGKGAAVLLECVLNLTANEMFFGPSVCLAEQTAQKTLDGICAVRERCGLLLAVTGNVFEDGKDYGKETRRYMQALGEVNRRLAAMADLVVEVVAGIPVVRKGER